MLTSKSSLFLLVKLISVIQPVRSCSALRFSLQLLYLKDQKVYVANVHKHLTDSISETKPYAYIRLYLVTSSAQACQSMLPVTYSSYFSGFLLIILPLKSL